MERCIFRRIVAGQAPASVIAEDDDAIAPTGEVSKRPLVARVHVPGASLAEGTPRGAAGRCPVQMERPRLAPDPVDTQSRRVGEVQGGEQGSPSLSPRGVRSLEPQPTATWLTRRAGEPIGILRSLADQGAP